MKNSIVEGLSGVSGELHVWMEVHFHTTLDSVGELTSDA